MLLSTLLPVLFLTQIGCSMRVASVGSSSQSSQSFSEESSFCNNQQTFENATTVTATAQFLARAVTTSGLLGATGTQRIRLAEVVVLNAQGQLVQCGLTNSSGEISLQLPRHNGNYILRVYSRSESSDLNVSVLNNPYDNLPYSIEKSFQVSESTSIVNVDLPVAPLDGQLQGGAFNIMDQIYKANQFLKSQAGGVIAPKARVFWTPGLSPYAYYGHPESGISFFSKSDDPAVGVRRGIYILGGLQGDVNCTDTDHFDNSVILHEYGHFLENSYGKSNSPGGSHNGNSVVDPRLAWSEGWSNFFQTAVLGENYYRDTVGNSNCSGGTYLALNLNLETAQSGQDRMPLGTQAGEGLFREISVSRSLFDIYLNTGADGGAGVGFAPIWKTFSDSVNGFNNPRIKFRNLGLFNQLIRSEIAVTQNSKLAAFDNVLTSEFQLSDEREYGLDVSAKSSSCPVTIQGVADSTSFGESTSHQLKSNDFFEYTYDGSNPLIELRYSGSTSPSDLDLYIYRDDYTYGDAADIVRSSRVAYPESGSGGYEAVNLQGLPNGTYMINVKVNSMRRGNPATYQISTNGGLNLCP